MRLELARADADCGAYQYLEKRDCPASVGIPTEFYDSVAYA